MMRESADRFDLSTARSDWDNASDAYADAQDRGVDYYRLNFFGPAMVEACGDVAGLDVLDLGCGAGYFSREMAKRGAKRVVGVDLSPNQIGHARRHEARGGLGIEYVIGDAAEVAETLPAASFDLVTACVSLIDMSDPGRAIRVAYRVLRDGGRLVFTNTHPVTDLMEREWVRKPDGEKVALQVSGYFDETPFVTEWMSDRYKYRFKTTGNNFTLETWMRWVIRAGFIIEDFIEPVASDGAIADWPGLDDSRIMPTFLIVVGRKDERLSPN